MKTSICFLFAAVFTSIAVAMTENDYRNMGCIACDAKPNCECPGEEFQCIIQERTCRTCYKVVCIPKAITISNPQAQTTATQSQSIAGIPFSTLPPLPPVTPPAAPLPTSTVVSSSTCVFPSTALVLSTASSTMRLPVYSTVTVVASSVAYQTQAFTTSVPVQIAGTVIVTQTIPTATSTLCITSFQIAQSTIPVQQVNTLPVTIPNTVASQVTTSSTINIVYSASSTIVNLSTSTVFPAPISSQGITVSSSTICTTSTLPSVCLTETITEERQHKGRNYRRHAYY